MGWIGAADRFRIADMTVFGDDELNDDGACIAALILDS